MKKIAVIYYSGTGHTALQAQHVAMGAKTISGLMVDSFAVEAVTDDPDSLNSYDALIFGAPTYMGSAPAAFKLFMDATSDIWFMQKWRDKIAAGFTNSASLSGDKFNTLMQLFTFASQHSMIWISYGEKDESCLPNGKVGDPMAINRMGASIGAMAQSDNLPAGQTPSKGDLQSAENLGKRVAKITAQFTFC